jgi:hypothetical protein
MCDQGAVSQNRLLVTLEALRMAMKGADSSRDKSFSEVFHGFLDATDDPVFLRESKPAKDTAVKTAIEACARKLTGDEATALQGLQMLRITAAGFLHGVFRAGPLMGSFFYFEKEGQGLLAFTRFGGMTHYTRITMTEIPEGTVFVRRPRNGSQAS